MSGLFSRLLALGDRPLRCTAIIAAAGSGERMEGANKLFAPLCGVPVLARTLLAFEQSPCINEIIVVARESETEAVAALVKEYAITKASKVLAGGPTRQASVLIGAMSAAKSSKLLAVQDGARPLVTPELIARVVSSAEERGAAIPAVRVKDTIKRAEGGKVLSTPDRSGLFAAQTPQVFRADVLKAALADAARENCELTDDASALERLGLEVAVEEGEYDNIKITTPMDLVLAEAVLNARRSLE